MKIAIYARVSTEDQYKNGLSIDTQLDNLREWAKQNNHIIVQEYVDGGISGKKPYSKRPALSQFMTDIANGVKIDALCFVKLDRFFRSVKLYYQAVAIMDKYGVAWQAIQEDYETITSAGRFRVNIMLSVAEAEADRTSERIKVVMETKRQRKEALSGHVPIGYKLDGKSIIKNEETAQIVETFFDEYLKSGSIKYASDKVEAKTGYHFYYRHASDTLKNPSYYGCFHGIEDYAPAYIDKDTFDRIQVMRRRIVRHTKYDQVYLFSGLLVCGECGSSMSPRTQRDRKIPPSVYNCRGRYEKHTCDNKVNIDERDVERFLLDTIDIKLSEYEIELGKAKTSDNSRQIAALKRKKEKAKEMFVADIISMDELKQRTAEIDKMLATLEPIKQPRNHKQDLPTNWRELYDGIDREAKKAFWRSIVSQIRVYSDRHIDYDLQ